MKLAQEVLRCCHIVLTQGTNQSYSHALLEKTLIMSLHQSERFIDIGLYTSVIFTLHINLLRIDHGTVNQERPHQRPNNLFSRAEGREPHRVSLNPRDRE